ncbi:TonB-dependent receptor domain-containing protein [Sandarakinorhabdus sp.]|uniref:TonB-dependent receptor domain-containing protein n=1 Tax=Sandarakinorhabdus sp. TaxID=1916663 RepID=UPI00286D7656|nr:TonB-dependent receptor [Sandarakinorhabdus sp.]
MRSIILAGASALAIVASPAFAAEDQDTKVAAGAAEETAAEMMVVTGSRIARENLDATVPITSLSAAELLQNGSVQVGDRLSLLPQFRPTFTSQNSGRFIGTAGLSILDLRGQGTARTLVLQNGLRHVTSQPGAQTVDVSTIPVDLIERVDIVTGGNSSVYGSDAVAGVVNFVLKRDFQGIMGRVQAGTSSRGDSNQYLATLTAGTNFADGRGNIAVSLEYNKSDPLFFADRPNTGAVTGRSQFQLVEDTTGEPAAGNGIFDTQYLSGIKNIGISTGGAYTSACQGVAPGARATLNCSGVFQGASQFGNVFVFQPGGNLARNVVDRDFRPFNSGNAQGGQGSTLRETGLMQIGNTRYAANLIGSFEVSDAFRPYIEAKWVRTESLQEGQPTFSSGALNPTLNISNPFLSQQARDLLAVSLPASGNFTISRFNIDFGGRGENHSRELFRAVAGAQGSFMDTWSYNVALNYGRVETFYQTRGNIHNGRFTNAVNAVRNTAGQIVCSINNDASAANDDPACRPINLFGLGAPQADALAYVGHTSSRKQWSEQFNVIANIAGDSSKLFELPGGPVGFSIGGEWRQERSFSAFDDVTRSGATFLNSIANFAPPRLDVWEAFGEIRLPILKDVPFFKELTVEAAGRVSNYSSGTTGTVTSYNVGGIWSPVDDVRIRANYGRAIRAPTQLDLFQAQNQTFLNGLIDPCGQQNINANPNRVANCRAAGVPTTQTFGGTTLPFTNIPASGISGLSGGNPGLFAEKSDSWTVGMVYTPSYLPGFVASVDFYRIAVSDVITTVASQTVINQCYDDPGGISNPFCSAVFRNPDGTFRGQSNIRHGGSEFPLTSTGASFITGPFNYSRQLTKGIDFDAAYTHKFGEDWRLNVRTLVSLLLKRHIYTSITEPNRLTREHGTLGNPELNGQLNVTVGYKSFDLLYSFRYLSKQTVATNWRDQNSEQGRPPENLDGFPTVFYPAITYSDVRFSAKVYKQVSAYVGVDNIFDQLPPLDNILGNGAGSGIYTNTGRFFYGGVQVKF